MSAGISACTAETERINRLEQPVSADGFVALATSSPNAVIEYDEDGSLEVVTFTYSIPNTTPSGYVYHWSTKLYRYVAFRLFDEDGSLLRNGTRIRFAIDSDPEVGAYSIGTDGTGDQVPLTYWGPQLGVAEFGRQDTTRVIRTYKDMVENIGIRFAYVEHPSVPRGGYYEGTIVTKPLAEMQNIMYPEPHKDGAPQSLRPFTDDVTPDKPCADVVGHRLW